MTPESKKLTLTIPKALHWNIKMVAHHHNMTVRALFIMVMAEFLKKMKEHDTPMSDSPAEQEGMKGG